MSTIDLEAVAVSVLGVDRRTGEVSAHDSHVRMDALRAAWKNAAKAEVSALDRWSGALDVALVVTDPDDHARVRGVVDGLATDCERIRDERIKAWHTYRMAVAGI